MSGVAATAGVIKVTATAATTTLLPIVRLPSWWMWTYLLAMSVITAEWPRRYRRELMREMRVAFRASKRKAVRHG